jgi:F-type H+-transporting ATPase subunit epsilon
MSNTFHLTIARVGENLFDAEAVSVTLPGVEGEFTLLQGHEPFVSELKQGEIRVRNADNQILQFPVSQGGIAETSHDQATVLL